MSFRVIPLFDHSGDPNLLASILILTVIIAVFAIANLLKFFAIWRKYKDFISLVLVGLPFLILIDEAWSLYVQWVQLTHTDIELLEHLTILRWTRLVERALAVILLAIFVIWNNKDG